MRKYKSLQEFFANKKRWVKCQMRKGEKRCLVGAMHDIYIVNGRERASGFDRLRKVISKRVNVPYIFCSVAGFNDAESTTIEDIREVCKAANV